MTAAKPDFGLLNGYRVVMIGLSVAAPFAGELYAEHGADVIWIENPKVIDPSRNSRKGGAWQQDRRNMRSLSLNYFQGEGRDVFLKLIASADVLIEGSVGGRFDKIGLSDEVLWAANPGLVIAHVSGYGQTGDPKYVSRPSYDPTAQAFGCLMRMNGVLGQPSIPAMTFPGDYTASFYAFGMTLAALLKRAQTGHGESIDLAQFELLARVQANYPLDYLRFGLDYTKEGSHSLICAGYGTYACADGKEVYILYLGAGVLARGLGLLGLEYGSELFPEGSSMAPINTAPGDALEAALAEFFADHTAAEAEELFYQAGVPCAQIMDYETAKTNPQYLAREVFTTWAAADGETILPGVNIMPRLKNNPGQIWRGAPAIGMDNDDILAELGISPDTVARLYAEEKLSKFEYTEYALL
jgi:L-carnitine CoA-transferase